MKRAYGLVGVFSLSLLACAVPTEGGEAQDLALACEAQALGEVRVCADGATVTGVDVSYWQGTVNWARVKGDGHQFGIARISDGLRYVDTQFVNNWRNMKAQGVVRGAYQFFRSNLDPIAQANLVLQKLEEAGGLEPDDLGVVLDIESTDGQSNATVVRKAQQWLDHIEARTGKRPLVYTAAFMSPTIGTNFRAYPLWVANYGATCPSMPSGWSHWDMWQYTDSGRVSGHSGNFDTNRFNGNRQALLDFVDSLNVGSSGGTGSSSSSGGGGSSSSSGGASSSSSGGPTYCTTATPTGLNGGGLNIRPEPNTNRAPLGTLREGQQVSILGRTDGEQVGNTRRWLRIRSPGGITGWVSGRYMRCVGQGVLAVEDEQPDESMMGFEEGRGMGDGEAYPGDSTEVVPPTCDVF